MSGRGRGRGRGRGKGSKSMRLLPKINEEIDQVPSPEPIEQQLVFALPTDLLPMIFSKLSKKDNIRASAVCKEWLNVAISVRNTDKPPLAMIFPKTGHLYEFCDPALRKSYWLELPELHGSQVCCAKEGWLLLYKQNTREVFFFSPYTRHLINLPYKQFKRNSFAFSAAPTSGNCILVAMEDFGPTSVLVSTFRPGQSTEWTTITYKTRSHFPCPFWNKLVFCKGLFYCFTYTGFVGIYNPDSVTWVVHRVRGLDLSHGFFLAEYDGDIFTMITDSLKSPKIYKLDLTEKVWSERKTLGGITHFVNYLSSLSRTGLGRMMRNNIYLSKVYYGKRCISYAVDEGRYYPKKDKPFDWEHTALYKSIWMEPPEDFSIFH